MNELVDRLRRDVEGFHTRLTDVEERLSTAENLIEQRPQSPPAGAEPLPPAADLSGIEARLSALEGTLGGITDEPLT